MIVWWVQRMGMVSAWIKLADQGCHEVEVGKFGG